MSMRIVVVGDHYDVRLNAWGDVELSPPVYGMSSSPGLTAKQVNIEAAMFEAVKRALPGDLILQDDVELFDDPWAAPVDKSAIRTLVGENMDPRLIGRHFCPQAFIFGEDVHHWLLSLWDPSRERFHGQNACSAWRPIPKQADYIAARHLTPLQ